MRRLTLSSPTVRICAANFLVMMGFQASYFVGVIGCATYELGAGAWEVSMLVLAINAFLVVGAFGAGSVVDHLGPRKTIAACLAAMAVSGLVGWLAPVCYPVLYFEGAMSGLLFGACSTAFDAYPRFMTAAPADLKRMNSLNAVAHNLTVIAGPALGGLIALALANRCVFAVLTACSLPAAALVWHTRESLAPAAARGATRPSVLADVAQGVRVTFASQALSFLFVAGFLGFFCYGAFDSLESLFYRDCLRVGSEWMGWLTAFAGIGGALGSVAMLRVPGRWVNMRLLSLCLLLTGVGSMVYVGTPVIGVAVAGQVLTGIGFGAMEPVRNTLLQESCSHEVVGRVTAVMRVGLNSAGVLPLLVAPCLADAFGVQPVLFGASTAVAAISAVLVALSRRRG